jgi:hypothetical protein
MTEQKRTNEEGEGKNIVKRRGGGSMNPLRDFERA